MKVGTLVHCDTKQWDIAQRIGFKSVELLISPGDSLDPGRASAKTLKEAKEGLDKRGLEISAVGFYRNVLDPDRKKAEQNVSFLESLMGLCRTMGVSTLCSFAGRDPEKDIPDNIPQFKKVWGSLAKKAGDGGLRIAFENCPMFHYFPFRGINIAFCPRAWDLMFDAVPSEVLGLEYDPSHLVCLQIDYIQVVRDYGKRIYHVHAKDAEILWPNVRRNGIMEREAVRHRMPGLGDTDWARLISALVESGYRGNLDVEGWHDPVYGGELEEAGLLLAYRHLSALVP